MSPDAPTRLVCVLSPIAANLAGIDMIIKHVFERVGSDRASFEVCVGGLFYRRDTLDQMFDYRTYERVQFEHKSDQLPGKEDT